MLKYLILLYVHLEELQHWVQILRRFNLYRPWSVNSRLAKSPLWRSCARITTLLESVILSPWDSFPLYSGCPQLLSEWVSASVFSTRLWTVWPQLPCSCYISPGAFYCAWYFVGDQYKCFGLRMRVSGCKEKDDQIVITFMWHLIKRHC